MFNPDVFLCTYISNSKKAECILCVHTYRPWLMELICQDLLQFMQFFCVSQKKNTLKFWRFYLFSIDPYLLFYNRTALFSLLN